MYVTCAWTPNKVLLEIIAVEIIEGQATHANQIAPIGSRCLGDNPT